MKYITLAAALALSACQSYTPSSRFDGTPMFVVKNLQPGMLAGTWYQVASFPTPFMDGCHLNTATYTPLPDGRINLVNQCQMVDQPGVFRQQQGIGTISGPGQLTVRTGSALNTRIWVLDISRDGRTVILASPNRQAGWVLQRERKVTPEQLDRAREVYARNGFDAAALQVTRQGPLWSR
ncbi:MAG: lipocalin [Cereibacter sphaeroides]|uniref:Outer membrane lipoprotein Blc n=1 Tax=Cereibacter sphaeroides TaxID=1063 RepID=A0A2W5SHS8_CERSP|nr:MAG: lipocalin [Cereibacter sphaeroides]